MLGCQKYKLDRPVTQAAAELQRSCPNPRPRHADARWGNRVLQFVWGLDPTEVAAHASASSRGVATYEREKISVRGLTMRFIAMLACTVMLICLGIAPGQAEKRVALVIGNSAYPGRAGLANPVNDATDVAAALRGIGFDVVPGTDLSLTGFAQIIDAFREKAKGADVALVYYAGHAMQFEEQNWLMPIDTRVTSTFDVRHYNVALQDMISEIESGAKTTLVFLDACRDNPLDDELKARLKAQGRSYGDARGLARLEIKAPDTLVVFATRPNTIAADGQGRRNSPFTEAFLENVSAPGIEIEVLMKRVTASVAAKTQGKQEPERLSRLKSEFYFVPTASGSAVAGAILSAPSNEASQAWAEVKDSKNQAMLEEFIKRFGDSFYVALARVRLGELKKSQVAVARPPAAAVVPAGITECDRVAAHPSDTTRPAGVAGLDFLQIDPAQAIPACQNALAARPDDVRMMFQLARALQKAGGTGSAEAARLYQKAADAGFAPAMTGLGFMYMNGKGVTKDVEEGLRWYRKAADAGDSDAMDNLGMAYRFGLGVAKDADEALRLFRRAAEAGSAGGMHNVGSMYESGQGVAKDVREAARWYRKAAEAGSVFAMYNAANVYANGMGVAKDEVQAVRWYRSAAEAGFGLAMNNLAIMYAQGRGVTKDAAEAVRWYRKAAEAGEVTAMNNLAVVYAEGRGVAKDTEEAVRWLQRAADKGDENAKANLKKLGR
jgi:uncharacterized protein